jgi:hypothetical protein
VTIAIPTVCHMADLSDLQSLIPPLMIQLLLGEPGISRKGSLYRREFVRLLAKAGQEHELARSAILAQIAEAARPAAEMERKGRQLYILGFTDHLETCINATHRCLRLLDRLKTELPVDRTTRRALESNAESLADMRNALEHMDEMIQRGELRPGEPIMIGLPDSQDKAVVAGFEVRFDDLARTLRRLHAAGSSLFPVSQAE